MARSSSVAPPRDDVVHDTSPRPPEAGQDLTRCGLSPAPPFKGTWFHLVATIPHQRRSPPAGCFAVSSHTVAFGGIRHGRFRRRSLLHSISAHGRLWQHPPISQPSRAPLRSLLEHDHSWQLSPFLQSSRAPLRRLLIHDRLWQLLPFHNLLAHPFAGFSHTGTTACSSFRPFTGFSRTPLQASRTRSHVAASPFHSLLPHPFAGISHTTACGGFRLFPVFSRTPSQASRTRSLVTAFAFPQSSREPLRRLLTRSLVAAFTLSQASRT